MAWQDIGITIIQWAFFLALIPAFRSAEKPPLLMSLFTGALCATLAYIFFTLHLLNGAASALLVSAGWFTLGLQKLRARRIAQP